MTTPEYLILPDSPTLLDAFAAAWAEALDASPLADMPDMHIALDGENEPTLWLRRPASSLGDKALARRCEMDMLAWALIVCAVQETDRLRRETDRLRQVTA